MKKILIYFLIILIPLSLTAQENIELAIKTDKTEYVLGEAVIIYVSLKNVGPTPIEVMRFLEPDYGFVQYSVKDPDGNEISFLPWALKENPAPQQRLSPEEAVRKEAKIFFGSNGWTFSKPGSYEISTVYMGNVESNSINITVLSPTDAVTKRAADLFLESEEVGYFLLLEGGDHLRDGMQRLEQVAIQMPNTPHATYANFALGANLMRDFANFKENRLREANPRRAIEFLEKVKAHPVSFYQMVHTHLFLSEGYTEIGDSSRAEAVRRDLNRATSEEYQDFLPLLNEILKSKGIQ